MQILITNNDILRRIDNTNLSTVLESVDLSRVEDEHAKIILRTIVNSQERLVEYLTEQVTGEVTDDSLTNKPTVSEVLAKRKLKPTTVISVNDNPPDDPEPPPRYA